MNTATRQLSTSLCSLLLSLALAACGGSSHSASTPTNGGASSGTNSGGTNTGSSNTGSTGGGTSGTSGTGSSGTGTSGGSRSTGATFVYASIIANGGGIVGYQQNSSNMLTAVSGSPYLQQGSGSSSALAVNNGNVYMANTPGSQTSPGFKPQLIQFKADPQTGSLTKVGTTDAGVGANGDNQFRKLLVNPSHNVMYGVFQYTIITYGLNGNGNPSVISSATPSTDSIWGFDFMPKGQYAYAAIQNGNPKVGFQYPQIVLMNIASDGSLTVNRTLLTLSNGSGIPGDLKIDPTGKYVVVTNGQSDNQLSVFAIQPDGSLNEVPGSPFTTGTQNDAFMSFDSTGRFLYVVSNALAQPQGENLQVFSFNPSTGTLSQVQNLTEPNEVMVSWLRVDGNLLYLTNIASGALSSTITVYNRDPNSGQLTQASNTTVQDAIAETDVLHF